MIEKPRADWPRRTMGTIAAALRVTRHPNPHTYAGECEGSSPFAAPSTRGRHRTAYSLVPLTLLAGPGCGRQAGGGSPRTGPSMPPDPGSHPTMGGSAPILRRAKGEWRGSRHACGRVNSNFAVHRREQVRRIAGRRDSRPAETQCNAATITRRPDTRAAHLRQHVTTGQSLGSTGSLSSARTANTAS